MMAASTQHQHTLLTNHLGILVITIVGISQLAIRLDLKLHELMTKLSCMTNTGDRKGGSDV